MAALLHLLHPRQDDQQKPPDDNKDDHHGLSGWAIFIIVVVVFLVVGAAAWFGWAYLRNRRSPSNFPAPRPGGIIGWVNDKFRNFKNRRYAAGSYESTAGGSLGGTRRGRGLDPDEAWDTRVGNEADVYGPGGYYEEQELGLRPPGESTAYTGGGYGASSGGFGASVEADRGRSRSRQRELDERYDAEMDGHGATTNPFGDDNAASLRGVSPRPLDTSGAHDKADGGHHSAGNSPTERRSMFRENM